MSDWTLLRDKLDLVDDPGLKDFASSLQSLPITDLVTGNWDKVVVTFLNASGNYVYGNRGSFNIQFVELIKPSGIGAPVCGVDSVLMEKGIGYRAILVPERSKGLAKASARLQDIVAPAGATRIRVFYKVVT